MKCIGIIAIAFFLLQFTSLLKIEAYDAQRYQQNQEQCKLCIEIVDGILQGKRQGYNDTVLASAAIKLCIERKFQLEYVCKGLILANQDIAGYILRNRPNITSQFICSVLFQGIGCPRKELDNPIIDLIIDPNRPKLRSSKNNFPSCNECNDLIIVQITDTHIDPNYEIGANAICGATTCCRKSQVLGVPNNTLNGAGICGDYRNCDPPLKAFINVLEQIKNTHEKIDFIYYTGDTVDHGIWETSILGNQKSFTDTFDAIRNYFPGIPIIPLIGNHEPHPVNQIYPANAENVNISSVEMYKFIANYWSWLPSDARKSIEKDGYYTMLLRKGLRIIAMNDNDCFTYNLWLLYDPTFPTKQMQWLHDTLLTAEKNKERVHLLAHIPPNDVEYYDVYSRVFRKIVDRFWNTISLMLNGHTHLDEFSLFYSLDDPKIAVNVAYNGGSTTPYSNVNPNYKVYQVEKKTFEVCNQYSYIYNLTEANDPSLGAYPRWFKLYDFLSDYGLKDLSPASLDKLLDDMACNPDKLSLYWQRKVKMGDPSLVGGCSDECLLDHLCQIIDTGVNSSRCKELTKRFQLQAYLKHTK